MRIHVSMISVLLSMLLGIIFVPTAAFAQTGTCATVISGQALPDLIVDPVALRNALVVTTEKFSQTQCAVVEGCVSSRGQHQLLRFAVSTPNMGSGDLVIGDPNACPNLFHLSECHGHLHYREFADYRLWTDVGYTAWTGSRDVNSPTNTPVNASLLADALRSGDLLVGRKQGFCMIDSARYSGSKTRQFVTCAYQGITSGWTDIYGQQLDCQYIQIDGLAEGIYVLEVQVNPEWFLPEETGKYNNNFATVRFQFTPKKAKTPANLTILN